jgi:hypothetical protein
VSQAGQLVTIRVLVTIATYIFDALPFDGLLPPIAGAQAGRSKKQAYAKQK